MTLATQLSLVREVRFTLRRPLAPVIIGASKVLSEGFWEGKPVARCHRPFWAVIAWRCRNFIPRFLWD
jgi:hypothetical protein